MSRRYSPTFSIDPSAAPVIVSIDGIAAGIALRDGRRFRFFAGHPGFDLLDGSRFSKIEDLHGAVRRVARATIEAGAQASRTAQTLETFAI